MQRGALFLNYNWMGVGLYSGNKFYLFYMGDFKILVSKYLLKFFLKDNVVGGCIWAFQQWGDYFLKEIRYPKYSIIIVQNRKKVIY
jgi:hypothetical protein